MKNYKAVCLSYAVVITIVLITSCARILPEKAANQLVPITTIGVLPARPVTITVDPSDTETMKQLEAGAQVLDTLLADYFKDYQEVQPISQTEVESLEAVETGNPYYLARAAGRQLDYDAVLITEVVRYQTRTGSAYAVDKPASVAFSLKLLAVENGQTVWSSDFDQTQQPLFENILSSRTTGSGFRWLTAAELARAGLAKKLNMCPYLKKN